MNVIPAIDVLGGRAVRLRRGRYDDVTVYANDPVEPARRFHDEGATRLHVVDLDGAREGRPVNLDVVERILAAVPMAVQVGGGVRDEAAARRWLDAGASVVLGTAAIKRPELVRALAAELPERVVVALDARGGEVAVEGWLESAGVTVAEVAVEMARAGVKRFLYTSIERDGTGEGPDVEGTAALQSALSGATVIASGGIGTPAHLRALARAGIREAVVGRALYDGSMTFEDARVAAEESEE
jgi:phosphoribosylformimino-5-aminoimidazole carboxamide ribotide isomerase